MFPSVIVKNLLLGPRQRRNIPPSALEGVGNSVDVKAKDAQARGAATARYFQIIHPQPFLYARGSARF
jgi:hypothetical protein